MRKRNNGRKLYRYTPALLACVLFPFIAPDPVWSQDAYKVETYHYNPAGKLDPFKPLVKKEVGKKKASAAQLTPLQQYDIGQLKLVGIAGSGKKKVAMVVDKKGRSYILSLGTYIGQNNGRVSGILDDQIVIEERTQGDSKKVRINRLTLKLHRYEEQP